MIEKPAQVLKVGGVLFFCLSLLVNPVCAKIVNLDNQKAPIDINALHYYVDGDGSLSPEEVLTGSKRALFKPYPAQGVPVSLEVKAYWIFVELKNTTTHDGDWVFDFENWSNVDFYQSNAEGKYELKRTGHLMPYFQRDYPVANQSYILTNIKAGETKSFWIQLRPVFNYEKIPKGLTFKAIPQDLQIQNDGMRRTIISTFLGIIAVMFFYNLFIYFSTRQKAYSLYLGLLFVMFLVTLSNAGLTILLFKKSISFPAWNIQLNYLFPHLLAIMPALFIREFLKIPETFPRWNKIILGLIAILVFNYVLMHFNFEVAFNLAGLLGLVAVIILMIVLIKSMLKKYPGAPILFLGYVLFFGLVIYTMFTFVGVLPSTYFAHNYSMALGTTIEMVVFSLALANQINSLKKENEAKQLQLIDNLREKEQMQSQMNKELEIKVEERTREIQQQKEKIEDQKEAIEIEMKKNEELLLNILPESTAKELILNGRAVPKSYDQVTILFADFQNFTAIAESLTPEKLVDNLDQYFRAFDNAITAFPIEKIKTIGDAYMCAGGLPEENSTNARDIALAAIKMMEEVDRINQQKVAAGEQPWNLRIGINTGPVTAGVVGKSKFAYDLWGDTVNIASRMETNSEAGKINVSESTYELVKDQFVFSYRGRVAAKNKGELDMYFLEGQTNDLELSSEKVGFE